MTYASSSCMDASYLRSSFVPQKTVKWRGKSVSIPDALDSSYQAVLNTLQPVTIAPKLPDPITSIAYSLYDNTSIFWAILAANGYFHALGIEDGTPVAYPDISNVLTVNSGSSATSSATTAKMVTI